MILEPYEKFFRRLFSKLGQAKELSLQFDYITDKIGSYLLRLKQCVQRFGYNEGQVLELFKTFYLEDITI